MKTTPIYTLILTFVLCNFQILGQSIGINTSTPESSAALDIVSDSTGLLIPRLTSFQRTSIFEPATGLLVYDMDKESFWYKTNTDWIKLSTKGVFQIDNGVIHSTESLNSNFVFGSDTLPGNERSHPNQLFFNRGKAGFHIGDQPNSYN